MTTARRFPWIGDEEPTVVKGLIVGDIWLDTTIPLSVVERVCESVGPVVFRILSVPVNYAGIKVDDNATALTPSIQHGWEKITIFDTDGEAIISSGDHTTDAITVGATGVYAILFFTSIFAGGTNKTYEIDAFEITSTTDVAEAITNASPPVVTATGHAFTNGQHVKISGDSGATALNDRIFTVANVAANTFELTEDNGGNIAASGVGGGDGVITLVTELNYVHTHRKFANQDVGSLSGGDDVSLTKDNTIELYYKNITDTTSITFEYLSLMLTRKS